MTTEAERDALRAELQDFEADQACEERCDALAAQVRAMHSLLSEVLDVCTRDDDLPNGLPMRIQAALAAAPQERAPEQAERYRTECADGRRCMSGCLMREPCRYLSPIPKDAP